MNTKHSFRVRAHLALTEYNGKGELFSTLEITVPPEELEFLRDTHELQDRQPVLYTLEVTNDSSGDRRRLSFSSKGSKMKDFVPVAVLVKPADPFDNLTVLFDHWALLLELHVEIVQEKGLFDEEPAEAAPTALLLPEDSFDDLAVERYLGEGCPNCTDGVDPAYLAVERLLTACLPAQLAVLMEFVGYDPTDWDDPKTTAEQDAGEWLNILLAHWQDLHGSEALRDAVRELAA